MRNGSSRIVTEAFDPQAEAAAFCAGRDDAGALVTFCGYCRSANKGEAVAELRLDQYEGFTRKGDRPHHRRTSRRVFPAPICW